MKILLELGRGIWLMIANTMLVVLSYIAGYTFISDAMDVIVPAASWSDLQVDNLIIFGLIMGVFVSFAVVLDTLEKIGIPEKLALILSAAMLLGFYLTNGRYLGPDLLAATIIGCVFAWIGMSETFRKWVISGRMPFWTVGHVVGTGLIPFIAGLGMYVSGHLQSRDLSNVILFDVDLVTKILLPILALFPYFAIVILLALHKWFERGPGRFTNGYPEIVVWREDAPPESKKLQDLTDDEKKIVRSRKKLLMYYMWILFLFPPTVAFLFWFSEFDDTFLTACFASFILAAAGYFYYPTLIRSKTANWSVIIRVSAVFLMVIGLCGRSLFGEVGLTCDISGWGVSWVVPLLVAVIAAILTAQRFIKSRFYKLRLYQLYASLVLMAAVHLLASNGDSDRAMTLLWFSFIAGCSILVFTIVILVSVALTKKNDGMKNAQSS